MSPHAYTEDQLVEQPRHADFRWRSDAYQHQHRGRLRRYPPHVEHVQEVERR